MAANVNDLQTPEQDTQFIVQDEMGGLIGQYPTNKAASVAALRASRQPSAVGKKFRIFGLVETVSTELADPSWDSHEPELESA